MLTPGQFAIATGIPVYTLRRLGRDGRLVPQCVTAGGHRRYSEGQVPEAAKHVRQSKMISGGKNAVGGPRLDDFIAYLLGLVLADGTVLASGQVQLELKDRQILEDVAAVMGVPVHPRKDRLTYRITVPRPIANSLVRLGANRRKSDGFRVARMAAVSFGHFLRGIFDGDGSAGRRFRRNGKQFTRVAFHGHVVPLGDIQKTLLDVYGIYVPWYPKKKGVMEERGSLETGKEATVKALAEVMYAGGGLALRRKSNVLKT